MGSRLEEIKGIAEGAATRPDLWSLFVNSMGIRTAAEVGVWKGEFAQHLLRSCPDIERYYMIDPWEHLSDWNKPFNVSTGDFDEIYTEAMNGTDFAKEKRVVLRGETKEVDHEIPDSSLDFVYIDGDHTLRGITIDLLRMYQKVRPGGWLAGDDFMATPWTHGGEFEPTLVFPYVVHFAEAMNAPVYALPRGQFVIERNDELTFTFVDLTGNYPTTALRDLLTRPSLFDRLKRAFR